MAGPIVATKLQPPLPRKRALERPRLRGLLDRAWDAKLTLISAPAGFGKTSLLADWIANSTSEGRTIAWLALDQGDAVASAFWPQVVASLRSALAKDGIAFAELLGASEPDNSFVAILINELAALDVTIALVLDDFHLLQSAEIDERIAYLAEHLPPHVHLVIATRSDPALPLPRLRARGELVEIRAAELRMSTQETEAYINEVMGLGLSPHDTKVLEERTEGWIAALQLAVISLDGRPDPSSFIAGFAGSGRYIVDYLVEEVLQRLPDDVRQFLFSTCVLRLFTAPLCDAVTGQVGSARGMLEQLERQNLFLIALDDRRQWYRYHHLFSDVLLAHIPALEQQTLSGIHRRASEWFEDNGERAEAIHHAIASGDFAWAAELLERDIPAMRKDRKEAQFRNWLKAIPDEVMRARPLLLLAHVGVLVSLGEFDGVQERLDAVESLLSRLQSRDGYLVHVELYRTALAQARGDLTAAEHHASRVLEIAPPDEPLGRAGAAGFLGIVSWSKGDLDSAARYWRESRDGLHAQGHVADVQGTTIALSDILNTQGRLSDAIRASEEALRVGTDGGRAVVRGVADTHANLCILHLERGEAEVAREHLNKSLDLGDVFGLPQHPYRSRVAEASLLIADGRPADAIVPLREAERLYVSDFFPNVRPVPALIARVQIKLGNLEDAEAWARSIDVDIEDELSFIREYEHITLARLLLARAGSDGQLARSAVSLLDRLRAAAMDGGRTASLIEIDILRALGFERLGRSTLALEALRHAVELAEPEGRTRPFTEEGAALKGLIRRASSNDKPSRFLQRLTEPSIAPPPVPIDSGGPIEPLSERELAVLRLLRTDLSGPELALELSVSLNTLRTHTKNIFEKLGVNSRRAAVRLAGEMNLFGRE